MPSTFDVRYYDPAAQDVVAGRHQAPDERALRARLQAEGKVVLGLRPAPRAASRRAHRGQAIDVAWWCRELRTLLTAGMTVVEAIETLHAQSPDGPRRTVHERLLRALGEGQPLSRALQAAGAFPEVLVASITASERTSNVTAALDDFLRSDSMLKALRGKAVSAAIYPAVVVTLGGVIALFLLIYVIPRFSQMYEGFQGAVSGPTRLLLSLSGIFTGRQPWLLTIFAALLVGAGWLWRTGALAGWAARTLDSIAPLRAQWDHFRLANLYQSLALMFRGGYTLDEALEVAALLGIGPRIEDGIALARRELAQGRPVAAAFGDAHLADVTVQRLLGVAERTGGFAAVLQTIADRHAEAFSTFIERATRIVEPLFLLLVALVVGGIIVMMYMPIFDIANGVR